MKLPRLFNFQRNVFLTWLVFSLAMITGENVAYSLEATLSPKPNPPEAGENEIEISLKDDAGKNLDKAEVKLLVFMPAMGTMQRMEEKVTVVPKGNGLYLAKYDLTMAGSWELILTVRAVGKEQVFNYSLTTGIPGITSKGSAGNPVQGAGGATILDIGRERLQKIGVRFSEVKHAPLTKMIRAVGIVEQDKTHREEITLRFQGYVVKQFKGRVGDKVGRGEPLFSIYSPDLVAAQSEFLLADKLSADGNHSLHQAAGERLKNLGLSDQDIAAIRKSGQPERNVIIRTPTAGTILEINAREGSTLSQGQVAYVVGDLSKSFIVARVFQQDIADLSIGQKAEIVMPSSSSSPVPGQVNLIFPQIEPGAGTANVRVEALKYTAGLKPGTYVDTRFDVNLGSRLIIPAEAILYSGLHTYVFVDKGNGNLEPREIEAGRTSGDDVEVSSGLKEGERVVSSGTFLLGSEAQLRSALPKWHDAKGKDSNTVNNGMQKAPEAGQ